MMIQTGISHSTYVRLCVFVFDSSPLSTTWDAQIRRALLGLVYCTVVGKRVRPSLATYQCYYV